MAIFETYSKRMKKVEEKIQDVYIYDEIPEKLRIQVVHILRDTIGVENYSVWEYIHSTMTKELGLFSLTDNAYHKDVDNCIEFLMICSDEEAIDFIELAFFVIDSEAFRNDYFTSRVMYSIKQSPDEAIEELNYRFKDNNVGFEFIKGELVRIDRIYLHKEAVKPAIRLLYEENFQGAAEEFLKSHEHYRKGNYKESMAEALKAFESTMKTICDKKGYGYQKDKDTSSKLISIILDNNLIPEYLRNHFSGLRTTLEAGLPTVRNKKAGHGQGSDLVKIEPYFVEYAINLAATNIVFLVNAYKSSK
jgi:hypothetical protein